MTPTMMYEEPLTSAVCAECGTRFWMYPEQHFSTCDRCSTAEPLYFDDWEE